MMHGLSVALKKPCIFDWKQKNEFLHSLMETFSKPPVVVEFVGEHEFEHEQEHLQTA